MSSRVLPHRVWTLVGTVSVIGGGLLGASSAAWAGAGTITTTVTSLQDTVTYSKGDLTTYVGYQVTISNDGGNTVNSIRFTAIPVVNAPAETAKFSSAEGANCQPTATPNEVECVMGQLIAGQAYPAVTLFYSAPVDPGVSGVFQVSLSGTTYYAEGTGGPKSPPKNSINRWIPDAFVTLGTANPTLVKSSVLKGGGTFFTGDGAVSTGADKITTRVNVPQAASFSKATIEESPCNTIGNFFVTCLQSVIQIVNASNETVSFAPSYLTIILRQDASNIKPGTKIGSIDVYYSPDPDTITPTQVGDCASPTAVLGGGVPCIAKRIYYKNNSVEGWTPDLDKDFEWQILNDRNGTYRFPG